MISQPMFKDFSLVIKARSDPYNEFEMQHFTFSPLLLLVGLARNELKDVDPEKVAASTLVAMLTELNKEFDFYTKEYE